MSTDSFHRHLRWSVNAATHYVLARLPPRPRLAFTRLLAIARARSELLRVPPTREGRYPTFDALRSLAIFHHEFLAEPEAWTGAPGGHPLVAIDSLARHLLGRYPTPRFLASVWFGAESRVERERRGWFITHARGRPFRSLPLPIAMTRRMEDVFLHSADHLSFAHALRRAEVIGLGGGEELARAVLATRLGHVFDRAAYWRGAIAWLARNQGELAVTEVGPIVDYLHDVQPVLRGRTIGTVRRALAGWHAQLGKRGASAYAWPRSRWRELFHETADGDDRVAWRLFELLDGAELAAEGRAMHHCVATYASDCRRRRSSIWSLRRRRLDDASHPPRSVLTIEIEARTATIVQVRGKANRPATGVPLELVRTWAAREGLSWR